jgi:8-oxo-dGTP pyrophosphatase MutT (NUDIX family)
MLDLKLDREGVPPKDAATLVLVRSNAGGGIEVFCVERNKKSRFLGGAIVFPGGKLDAGDAAPEWEAVVTPPRDPALRAHAIAACRESLEEAALLPVDGGSLSDAELSDLRKQHADDAAALRAFLAARGMRLDLGALHVFARWVTPVAENRRYDTRFFVAVAPPGQSGAHDETETTASFWASPAEVLRRFDAGEVQLAPPTHRTLSLLAECTNTDAVLAFAAGACLDPICPKLVPHEDAQGKTLALVLPGDPAHEVRESRVPGGSRYVLRGERWLSEIAQA